MQTNKFIYMHVQYMNVCGNCLRVSSNREGTVKSLLCENPRFIILEIPDEERAQYEL